MAEIKPNFMFDVPNDKDGRLFLKLMHRYKANGMGFRSYGRHSDRQKLKNEGKTICPWSHNDVPIEHAEHIVVYGTYRGPYGSRRIFGPQEMERACADQKLEYEEQRRLRLAEIDAEIAENQEQLARLKQYRASI